jgi:YidC/Oxa1 family membrane protein insertase
VDGGGLATANPASGNEWDALLNEASASHVMNTEPHIGWLKELGLDYGWGPTSLMQTILESFNLFTDLPWWACIMAVGYGARLLILPLHVRASDTSARLAHAQPLMAPIQQKLRESGLAGDKIAQAAATQEFRATLKAAGVKYSDLFKPILLQGFLGFGLFRLVNGMSHLPVPGFADGGMLWFTDLTMTDPFGVLPIASGLMMWYVVKVNSLSQPPSPRTHELQ